MQRFTQLSAVVPMNEPGAAAGNVDHLADQIRIEPGDEILQVQVDVIRRRAELGGKVVAQVIRVQSIGVGGGHDEGATPLGHLLAVHGEKAVHEDARGLAKTRTAEHRRPEQRVKVDDVLADEMVQLGARSVAGGRDAVGRLAVSARRSAAAPVIFEHQPGIGPSAEFQKTRHVADGRIEPDIEVLAGFTRNFEAEVG